MAGNYEVGKRKPPKHTRYKKGQSGNPKGRPKGAKNVATDLAEEASELVAVREGDRVIKVSKQRVMIKALFNKAMKGDVRAATTVLAMTQKIGDQAGADLAAPELQLDEEALLEFLTQRAARRAGGKS